MKTISHSTDFSVRYHQWLDAGTAASTRRAYVKDVARFWAWAKQQSPPHPEHWPVSVHLVIEYILDHLPGGSAPPLKLSTLRHYLASLSVAHTERNLPSPTPDPQVSLLLQ